MLSIKSKKDVVVTVALQAITLYHTYSLPIEYMYMNSCKLSYKGIEYQLSIINVNIDGWYELRQNLDTTLPYITIYTKENNSSLYVDLGINNIFPPYGAPKSVDLLVSIDIDTIEPTMLSLTYLYQDPFIQDTTVYEYSTDLTNCTAIINFNSVTGLFEYINIDRLQLLQNNKLRITGFKTTTNTNLWVMFNNYILLDHKYNQYSYNEIILKNDSDTASIRNIIVLSEAISLYFNRPYPHRFKGQIVDGYYTLFGYNFSYCSNLFYGFFNNSLVGKCIGYQDKVYFSNSFDSNKIGNIDIIPLGTIEFSINNIDWFNMLNIPKLGIKESIIIKTRVFKQQLSQSTIYSSVRAIGLEDL